MSRDNNLQSVQIYGTYKLHIQFYVHFALKYCAKLVFLSSVLMQIICRETHFGRLESLAEPKSSRAKERIFSFRLLPLFTVIAISFRRTTESLQDPRFDTS